MTADSDICVHIHIFLFNTFNRTVSYERSSCSYYIINLKLKFLVESNPYQQISAGGNDVCIEMDILRVGSEPVGMRCPHCQEDVMTRATYKNSTLTHIMAAVLGILFWWICCCVLPYVTKRWKNVEHYCPRCAAFLGVFTRKSII